MINMNKAALITTTLIICLITTSALAADLQKSMRRQADSDFRIAEKAYRKAVKDYGKAFNGLPDSEKTSACKKINSALYTNRHNMVAEDTFRQQQLKQQIGKLEQYGSELECVPKK